MLTVRKNKKTETHIVQLLGLTIGFDKTEWMDNMLLLSLDDNVVASLEGELLAAFKKIEYVKSNYLA